MRKYFALFDDGMGGFFRSRLDGREEMDKWRAEGHPVYSLAEGDFDHRSAIGRALMRLRLDIAQGTVRESWWFRQGTVRQLA